MVDSTGGGRAEVEDLVRGGAVPEILVPVVGGPHAGALVRVPEPVGPSAPYIMVEWSGELHRRQAGQVRYLVRRAFVRLPPPAGPIYSCWVVARVGASTADLEAGVTLAWRSGWRAPEAVRMPPQGVAVDRR